MKMSESMLKIAPALLKAQQQMESAKKGSANPFFKSKYADFGAVLEACKGPLNDNDIVILQPHRLELGETVVGVVETILMHSSGEYISSETEIKCAKANDPQALGSAITYARRYGLQSLIALPAEDDDGNKGAAKPNNATKVTKAPAKVEAPARRTPTKVEEVKVETTDPAPTRRVRRS